jgi:hypothetical protein
VLVLLLRLLLLAPGLCRLRLLALRAGNGAAAGTRRSGICQPIDSDEW